MRIVPGDQMMYEVPGTVLTELRDLRAEVARLREALREIADLYDGEEFTDPSDANERRMDIARAALEAS